MTLGDFERYLRLRDRRKIGKVWPNHELGGYDVAPIDPETGLSMHAARVRVPEPGFFALLAALESGAELSVEQERVVYG
jgi:hypothetical protein